MWEDLTAVPRARWATVHIMRDGNREIMLNDQGELIFARLTPDGYHEQSRAKLIDRTRKQLRRRGGVVWAHPAVAGGHIFARNDEETGLRVVAAGVTTVREKSAADLWFKAVRRHLGTVQK